MESGTLAGEKISLNGNDWLMKEFVGMDWIWRDSVKPDTKDVRWWYPARVPGSVVDDLMKNKLVPDPYYELNSKLAEWAAARTWVYKKEFTVPKKARGKRIELCFAGIDYEAEIFLNGESLGKQCGMFVPWKARIEEKLKFGEKNLLAAVIEPAPFEQPQVGKTALVHTHKSRMTYWWDFCPRLVHQGIWQDVYLKITGEAYLEDVHVKTRLEGQDRAVVSFTITAENAEECRALFSFGEARQEGTVRNGCFAGEIVIEDPRLWWCNGQGGQFEYEVRAILYAPDGEKSDAVSFCRGIREICFVGNEGVTDEKGRFFLQVNGRPVFINGYNWVPADVLYGAVSEEKTAHLICLAQKAGVNMFRVWGGGLIERDSFYRLCAKAGILIWQEFMLSSSGIDNRPSEDPAYEELLEREAKSIILQKRNHTALAVWCGGNELQETDGRPLAPEGPAVRGLGAAVEKWDPDRKWLPTSPSGGVFLNSMENLTGCPDQLYDVHGPWEHQGLEKHYELYNKGTCLLHSEFGVEGMTGYTTLRRVCAPEHLLPASKDNPVYFHRGAWWNNEPLVQESFGGALFDIEQIRKASQYLQYEGLKYAMECSRRRAFFCSGIFPWQFNEPYPNLYCTSAVDYYGNPKPVYYGAKKVYGPWLVNASFETSALKGKEILEAEIFAMSNVPEACRQEHGAYEVDACIWGMDGSLLYERRYPVVMPEEKSVPAGKLTWKRTGGHGLFLMRLSLTDSLTRTQLAQNEYLFSAGADFGEVFSRKPPRLEIKASGQKIRITNTGKTAALFVFVTKEEGSPVYWEDNYKTVLPGETRTWVAEGRLESAAVEALNYGREVGYESSSRN